MTIEGDVPMPDRKKLVEAIAAAEFAKRNAGTLSKEEQEELLEGAKWAIHAIPESLDFVDLCTRHPLNQVFFRAGLLACREYMARFVEAENPAIANSIRQNWWPQLGEDPGPPRLFDFDEVAEEIEASEDGPYRIKEKDVPLNVEALPRAFQFLQQPRT